jgi:aldehyde dehydrogenase (NAD+)
MAVTTSIGPGATNVVTAAALAYVNRLPLLIIPGDVFANRAPDPVLQQVESFADGTVSANDCFRAVSRYFEYYGGAADKVHGDTIPVLEGFLVNTLYEPLGVTAHIIPWNYPGQMFGRTVAPALAMGNATVIKPAEEACMVPLRLAELAAEAGFPEGAINVVPGLGEEAGAALSNHRGIDFISFTGSPEVGTLIQAMGTGIRDGQCDRGNAGARQQFDFHESPLVLVRRGLAPAVYCQLKR